MINIRICHYTQIFLFLYRIVTHTVISHKKYNTQNLYLTMINAKKTILALLAAGTVLGAAAQGEVEDYRRAFAASGNFTYD